MAYQPNVVKTGLIPTQEEKDDYAIEFAEWCLDNNQIIQNDGKELLEIFKKEKGL